MQTLITQRKGMTNGKPVFVERYPETTDER